MGLLAGGAMVDRVCEPVMASVPPGGIWSMLFGAGKGSGAAMTMFLLGIAGVTVCLSFGRILRKYSYTDTQ